MDEFLLLVRCLEDSYRYDLTWEIVLYYIDIIHYIAKSVVWCSLHDCWRVNVSTHIWKTLVFVLLSESKVLNM